MATLERHFQKELNNTWLLSIFDPKVRLLKLV
jgi:hypothetical protein